jgi:uncharacterized protein (UPF0216 family)
MDFFVEKFLSMGGKWNVFMPDRPSITDESVLLRWMKLEIGKINESIVVERKTIIQLLTEGHPSASTKGGKEHFFDIGVVRIFEKSLPKGLHSRLRLPILFYFDPEVTDSCYLTDEMAVEALELLGEISPLRTLREGKLWVSRVLVYELIRKYQTAIQIVIG